MVVFLFFFFYPHPLPMVVFQRNTGHTNGWASGQGLQEARRSRVLAAAFSLRVCFFSCSTAPMPPCHNPQNPQRITGRISVPVPDFLESGWHGLGQQFQTTWHCSHREMGSVPLPLNLGRLAMALTNGVWQKWGHVTSEAEL